ncbi:MAG: TIGR01777 family protein [Bacteriovoracaceae bacterium]|nr:TIGR01777 family protein [Bacteriovoracaceae bacterium]
MKILITGATGFVGTALSKKLLDDGHELHVLTRDITHLPSLFVNPKVKVFEWKNTLTIPPEESISGIDGVINLMGENIAGKKWSEEQKEILRASRVDSTKNLTTLLNEKLNSPLKFFISSSAVGIYPTNKNEILDEEAKIGNNFLANLCLEWENAALTIKKTSRIVIIRTGVVLESHGGALKKMLLPFKLGLGGPIGDGDHFMSWIHLEDLVNIFTKAVNDSSYEGVYNGVAPHPVDNFDFTKALGHALNRPTLFPVPAPMLKIMFGEMSSVILDSQKVVSKRLKDNNFVFLYPSVDSALNKIFKRS